MLNWLRFSFAGWLLRKQLIILLNLCVFLTRTTYSLFKLVSRGRFLPKGKLIWEGSGGAQRSEQDETTREAGCKQVVFEFAAAIGYIARQAMSKEELENKIYTQKVVVSLNCRDEVLPAEYHTIRASQGTKVP